MLGFCTDMLLTNPYNIDFVELLISCDVVIHKTSFHTNHDFSLSTNIELKFGEQNHDKQLLAEVSKIQPEKSVEVVILSWHLTS